MKISIRNLWSLICLLVLLGAQVLPAYTQADEVSSTNTLPTLTAGMIGKVTYLLGQADMISADGSVSPLALQMEIPDGSRITVKERSRISLLMMDGGIEKLGADTVFIFNKYAYDPDDAQSTEIRKTLLNGEVTSTTGRGGEDAKERYRMNSPLAAIAVLGTEYTVKVSKGETWVTVHSGEISIAKLGGSCQRSGLGACAGGERLSEGQRGLALVVRANDPKPILMPATAIPATESKAEAPPAPVKEAEKEKDAEKASTKESEAAGKTATTEKPAESETQKSPQAPTAAAASTSQPDNTKQQDHTSSMAASSAPASPASTATAPPALPVIDAAPSLPEPKSVEKTSSPLASSLAPMTEKSAATAVATDERNPLDTIFTAPAISTVESAAVSTPRTQALPSVTLEAATTSVTTSKETVSSTQQQETTVVSTTKAKQSLVQSNNSTAILPAPEKVSVAPVVTTTPTPSVVESVPAKPAVATVTVAPVVVTPAVTPVTEKPKVTVITAPVVEPAPVVLVAPEKPKETPVTVVATSVAPPVAEPVSEKPKVETVVVAPVVEPVPVVLAVPEKPKEASVTVVATPVAPPTVVLELPTPTVNWGKYDPAATVDGKTSFSEQIGSSYAQLLQPVNASPSNPILQQNPSVSPPEPDKKGNVGVALDNVAAPVTTTVSNADTSKTTLGDDSATRQTPLITAPLTTAAPSIVVPLTTAAPSIVAPLTTTPLTPTINTGGVSAAAVLDRTSDSPLTPLTPVTLTPPLASP